MTGRRRGIRAAAAFGLVVLMAVSGCNADDGRRESLGTPAPGSSASPTAVAAASPSASSTGAACGDGAPGSRQPWFDKTDGWRVTAGKAVLEAARGPDPTTPAIRLDNGQNTQVATAALILGTPADLSAAQGFGVFIRQNSNLKREPGWSIRLRSGPKAYFERVFPVDEIVESGGKWCQDRSSPGDWATTGSPSWARITAVELLVPAYAGAGAGNVVDYATFSVYL